MLLFVAAAFASDGFALERADGDCAVYRRARSESAPTAMRAVCTWSEVDPARLGGMLADFDRYDALIWVVDASEVRQRDGDRALVYQLQQMWGMADREVLLWARTEAVDGGSRHCWTTAPDEPLALRKGAIRTPVNEGCWEVRANPEGPGARVTHEIAVDAGGTPLPEWLVRFARTRGFARVMADVRAAAVAGQLGGQTGAVLGGTREGR